MWVVFGSKSRNTIGFSSKLIVKESSKLKVEGQNSKEGHFRLRVSDSAIFTVGSSTFQLSALSYMLLALVKNPIFKKPENFFAFYSCFLFSLGHFLKELNLALVQTADGVFKHYQQVVDAA